MKQFLLLICAIAPIISLAQDLKTEKDFVQKVNGVEIRFIYIEGGEFEIGQPNPNIGGKRYSKFEQPPSKRTVKSFWVAETELTQAQHKAIMGKYRPLRVMDDWEFGDSLPARMSWYTAVDICNKLSELSGLEPYYIVDKKKKDPDNKATYGRHYLVQVNEDANGYRLPYEAEWEFVALGGKGYSDYYPGTGKTGNVAKYFNFCDKNCKLSSRHKKYDDGFVKIAPVKTYKPNRLGIYGLGGNLREWCFDWLDSYALRTKKYGQWRVVRGGSYEHSLYSCRSKFRSGITPRDLKPGLRIVRSSE